MFDGDCIIEFFDSLSDSSFNRRPASKTFALLLDVISQIVGKLFELDTGLSKPHLERQLAVPEVPVQC